MLGGLRDDTIMGGSGDDVMLGIGGDDLLSGGKGFDLLEGYDGQDTLDGGFGDDTLAGGSDLDTFVFGPRCGHDTLVTYEAGEPILIDAGFWSGSVADFVAARVTISSAEVVTIRLGITNSITPPGFEVPDAAALADVISFV
jgi:Ca2+-binding RTX toxin-like protein